MAKLASSLTVSPNSVLPVLSFSPWFRQARRQEEVVIDKYSRGEEDWHKASVLI